MLSEWRSFYQMGGLLSFLSGVSFLIYFFSGEQSLRTWNLMYWIVFLFLSFYAGGRLYEEDNSKYRNYNHQLTNPFYVFIAKVLYLSFLLTALGLILLLVFNALIPVNNGLNGSWVIVLLFASIGFSVLTCYTSFIASHGQGKQILMIVITLPLCFPLLGMSYAFCLSVLEAYEWDVLVQKFYPIIAIDLFAVALVSILLPLSWKN